MISIVLTGRNDDYGSGFRERLFRVTKHNARLLASAEVPFEFILAEWNPPPGRPLLAGEFVRRVPHARAVVIPEAIHRVYNLNPAMAFHEMPAKNAAIRRAAGHFVIATNADILFGEGLVRRVAAGLRGDTLYRAHRIDVAPGLSWAEMLDPVNQLPSAEGQLPPCWYLGAGGDFCLASRSLWSRLRGFNERIRFSTRAKDWQFYLTADRMGARVVFIGDVFHLDHEAGFRNTPAHVADSDTAPFGGPWDIEFGLPVRNPDDWGFAGLPSVVHPDDGRILILDDAQYRLSAARERDDRALMAWLTRPPAATLASIARLVHSIWAAHRMRRRLVCRIRDPRLAVALAGFAPIAALHGVSVLCDWRWPELDGFTMPVFASEPDELMPGDWVVDEADERLRIREARSKSEVEVAPRRIPILNPAFSPLMVRRLLHAVLILQEEGLRRIAIYGAGGHTHRMLSWGLPDGLDVAAVLTSLPAPDTLRGLPVVGLNEARELGLDGVLLSSSSFEPEMLRAAGRAGLPRTLGLYGVEPPEGSGDPLGEPVPQGTMD